jgi:hypothetical protein
MARLAARVPMRGNEGWPNEFGPRFLSASAINQYPSASVIRQIREIRGQISLQNLLFLWTADYGLLL